MPGSLTGVVSGAKVVKLYVVKMEIVREAKRHEKTSETPRKPRAASGRFHISVHPPLLGAHFARIASPKGSFQPSGSAAPPEATGRRFLSEPN